MSRVDTTINLERVSLVNPLCELQTTMILSNRVGKTISNYIMYSAGVAMHQLKNSNITLNLLSVYGSRLGALLINVIFGYETGFVGGIDNRQKFDSHQGQGLIRPTTSRESLS